METTEIIDGKNITLERAGEEDRTLIFKNDMCAVCGLCETICPVSAIEANPTGAMIRTEQDMSKIDIDVNKCVLCGMCSSICPFQALDLQINGDSIRELQYPQLIKSAEIDNEECIHCKACETACPQDAIIITRELPSRAELITGEIDIDKDTCIYCGMCEEMCPVDAIDIEHQNPTSDNPVVATDINVSEDICVHCGICKRICPVDAIKQVCRICPYGEYEISVPEINGNSYIDPELCVNCTWCQEICPVDAAKVTKPFEGELTIEQDTCQGCETCVMVCPCNVLSFPKSAKSGLKAEKLHKDERFCIYCGACQKSCPVDAINVKRTQINYTPTKSKAWKKAFESLKQ